MENKEKWSMFRNFMYNEIGITKHDIHTWIRETAQEEVRLLVAQTFGKYSIKELISNEIINEIRKETRYGIKDQICKEVGKLIVENLITKEDEINKK